MFGSAISPLHNQPPILPFDDKVGVHGDAEILVIHLGNVFDVDANGDIRGAFIFRQFKLDVVGGYANSRPFAISTGPYRLIFAGQHIKLEQEENKES